MVRTAYGVKYNRKIKIPDSNCNVIQKTSICELSDCIETITGLKSNSSSPTDILIGTLKSGAVFGPNVLTGEDLNVFIKLYMEPKSVSRPNEIMVSNIVKNLEGLNYERYIYMITSAMMHENFCKLFVKYYTSGVGCGFEELINFLTNLSTSETREEELAENFIRNQIVVLSELYRNRDSVFDNMNKTSFKQHVKRIARKELKDLAEEIIRSRFNFILTKSITQSKTKTFSDFSKRILNKFSDQEFHSVVIQVLFACFAMSSIGIVHNDLHTHNIWVEETYRVPTDVFFSINGTKYSFKTKHTVLVYDFDRAYHQKFGINQNLTIDYVMESSQRNQFIENLDAIKFLGYLYNCGDTVNMPLFIDVTNDSSPMNFHKMVAYSVCGGNISSKITQLHTIYRTGCFLKTPRTRKAFDDYQMFNTTLNILNSYWGYSNIAIPEVVSAISIGETTPDKIALINDFIDTRILDFKNHVDAKIYDINDITIPESPAVIVSPIQTLNTSRISGSQSILTPASPVRRRLPASSGRRQNSFVSIDLNTTASNRIRTRSASVSRRNPANVLMFPTLSPTQLMSRRRPVVLPPPPPRVPPPRASPPRASPPRASPPRASPPRASPPRASPPRASPIRVTRLSPRLQLQPRTRRFAQDSNYFMAPMQQLPPQQQPPLRSTAPRNIVDRIFGIFRGSQPRRRTASPRRSPPRRTSSSFEVI